MRSFALPALLLSASLPAQTFTAADAVPPNGTYALSRYYADASGWSSVDTVGTGLTWNITSLDWEPDSSLTLAVMPAADSDFAALAPDATTCLVESVTDDIDLHWFYRNASDMLEAIGIAAIIPGVAPTLEGTCPRLLLNYPASMGAVVSPGLTGCDMDVDAVERKVLATGTLITPYGTVANMTLIRTTICATDPFGKGEIICTHRYEWFAPGDLLRPRLTVFMENGEWGTAYLEVLTGYTSINDRLSVDATLTLSPNPASQHAVITCTAGLPLGELAILAADGREVYTDFTNTDRMQLDVHGLAPGIYSALCTGSGRLQVVRFVKE